MDTSFLRPIKMYLQILIVLIVSSLLPHSLNAADNPFASPASIDWGDVTINESHEAFVTVTNPNTFGLIVHPFITAGTDYFSYTANDCNNLVPPGGSCTLTLTFAPGNTTERQNGELAVAFAPLPPSDVNASQGQYHSAIYVDWPDVGGADAGYELRYRKVTEEWPHAAQVTLNQAASEYMLDTTAFGEESVEARYFFQARSLNAYGASDWVPAEPGAEGWAAQSCSAQEPLKWGHGVNVGNCAGDLALIPPTDPGDGSPIASTITGPITISSVANNTAGSIDVVCDHLTGDFAFSSQVCTDGSGITPDAAQLSASDGTEPFAISLAWSSVASGAYAIRERTDGHWEMLIEDHVPTEWTWSVGDEELHTFELGVQATPGAPIVWTAITEDGYAMPHYLPVHEHDQFQPGMEAGTPPSLRVGVGDLFSLTQTWRNNGSQSWVSPGNGYQISVNSPWLIDQQVWLPGETINGQTANITLDLEAPSVAGVYTLQTRFGVNGENYGDPSAPVNITVLEPPSCTGVAPSLTSTWNPNESVRVLITAPRSVESAWVTATHDGTGVTKTYAASNTGTLESPIWSANVPISELIMNPQSEYGNIILSAEVDNGLPTSHPVPCDTNAVVQYLELPRPTVELTPVLGSFNGNNSEAGFVVRRSDGQFAKIKVGLGTFVNLTADVKVMDGTGQNALDQRFGLVTNVEAALHMLNTTGISTWQKSVGLLEVTYSDPNAKLQNKKTELPLVWMVGPYAMDVALSVTSTTPLNYIATVTNNGFYDAAVHGDFDVRLATTPNEEIVGERMAVDNTGSWLFTNLSYTALFDETLVATAEAKPPAGVNLLQPITYRSAPVSAPLHAPTSVSATDGSRRDDVLIEWDKAIADPRVRYRIYRDGLDVTGTSIGISDLRFIDNPPERGRIYSYGVRTLFNNRLSDDMPIDDGYVPLCREARLVGASLDASMSAINGLIEQWPCLTSATVQYSFDSSPFTEMPEGAISSGGLFRTIALPLPDDMIDGAHTLNLAIHSFRDLDGPGGTDPELDLTRTNTIDFDLDRASITVDSMTITFNGLEAIDGVTTDSVGRFGVRIEGAEGVGVADPVVRQYR